MERTEQIETGDHVHPSGTPGGRLDPRTIGVLVTVAVATVALLAFVFSRDSATADDGAISTGGPSAEAQGIHGLVFVATDGSDATLADFGGQPLVVNFFASWCAPCRAELPDFERVHEVARDDVQFIGVSHDIDESSWLALVDEVGVTYPTFYQPEQEIFEHLDLLGMPSTAFITADGEVAHTFSGLLDSERLSELIAEHLGVEV